MRQCPDCGRKSALKTLRTDDKQGASSHKYPVRLLEGGETRDIGLGLIIAAEYPPPRIVEASRVEEDGIVTEQTIWELDHMDEEDMPVYVQIERRALPRERSDS